MGREPLNFLFNRFGSGRWRQTALVIGLTLCLGLIFAAKFAMAEKEEGGQPSVNPPALREFPDSLFGVAFGANGEALATGYHGAVKVSKDDGQHWAPLDAKTTDLLRRVVYAGNGAYFAVSSGGKILKSTDEGRTWALVHSEANLYLRDLAFADAQNGWVSGHDGAIFHTADGGASWQEQALKDWNGHDKPRLSGIAAIDARRAVVVGEFGVVAFTLDGGDTWSIASSTTLPTMTAVAMRGNHGVAVGLNGAIVRLALSAEGRLSVDPVDTGTSKHMLAVAMSVDGESALIAGRETLQVYSDGKLTTVVDASGRGFANLFIGGVAISGEGHVLAVGQAGMILRATGVTGPYQSVSSQNTEAPDQDSGYSVFFSSIPMKKR